MQEAMAAGPRPTQPTLPDAKLPQYQLGYGHRSMPSAERLQDARLRFLLALPSRPILVEATITIDGKPFRMAREERIQRLLKSAMQPDPASDPPEENEVQTAENAEPTVPRYTPATTAEQRIRRYVAATGTEPSANEVRWLLANWVDGPTLLMLNDNFGRFRADQRPVFHVLDRDRDGTVSADELELAVQSFNECDLNRDHIVHYAEIAKAADDPRLPVTPKFVPGALIFRLPDAASSASTYRRLASRYGSPLSGQDDSSTTTAVLSRFDTNGNGEFDADELQALQNMEPDVSLTVSFHTTDAVESVVAVTGVSSAFEKAFAAATVKGSAITLPLGGVPVQFSAVQAGASDQVSIGAVNDGYPILPAIDPDDDGRFTIRELRGLVDRLRAFDRNRDGKLTSDEIQAPIRVCFGLGPLVHRELAAIRSVNSRPDTPPVTGPEWFVRMDRNKDNDLTRGEFPGTDEQFTALDADNDELISVKEAVEFDRQSPSPNEESPNAETAPPNPGSSELKQYKTNLP